MAGAPDVGEQAQWWIIHLRMCMLSFQCLPYSMAFRRLSDRAARRTFFTAVCATNWALQRALILLCGSFTCLLARVPRHSPACRLRFGTLAAAGTYAIEK